MEVHYLRQRLLKRLHVDHSHACRTAFPRKYFQDQAASNFIETFCALIRNHGAFI